ncbi:MAG: hypothetical protein WBC06_10155 [Chitinophagaceae bacterium]
MKNLRTSVLCFIVSIFTLVANAQNNSIPVNEPDYSKPRLFENLPDQIPINIGIINGLLSAQIGSTVDMNLTDGVAFNFKGEVVSAAAKFQNSMTSVVIRSSNFNGARFTITKITDDDGNVNYTGRIISMKNADLYELKNKNGSYVLIKRNYYDLINE